MKLKEPLKNRELRKTIELLKRNGFEREDELHYIKGSLSVDLTGYEIQIAFPDGYTLPTENVGYMNMLGILTYLELSNTVGMRITL